MTNKTLWTNVEEMAIKYATAADDYVKQEVLLEIFEAMERYIRTCVNNSVRKAQNYGVEIPKEDFESRYMEYLWEALEAFVKSEGQHKFKNIVLRRFGFAEAHTWRQYQTKGDESDKDGVSYVTARWDSLDRKVGGNDSEDDKTFADIVLGDTASAEDEYIDRSEEEEILQDFAKVNARYANVIRYMAQGYDGDALAQITGEAETNNSKMRKLVQRSRDSFEKFMKERMSR